MPEVEAIKKTVFFVTRIGKPDTAPRTRSDDLMEFLLEPVVRDLDDQLTVVRADKLAAYGRITNEIVYHLINSKLIVVDATGLNPNVFYELGIAHAYQRRVVLLIDDPAAIPFDVQQEACIPVPGEGALPARLIKELHPVLLEALTKALNEQIAPGPVAAALAQLAPLNITADEATKLLREQVADLRERMAGLEHRLPVYEPITSYVDSGITFDYSAMQNTPVWHMGNPQFWDYYTQAASTPTPKSEIDGVLDELIAKYKLGDLRIQVQGGRASVELRFADGDLTSRAVSLPPTATTPKAVRTFAEAFIQSALTQRSATGR
jgi:hypothetical protein